MIEDSPVHASAQRALAALSPIGKGGDVPATDAWTGIWPALERDGFTLPAVSADLGGTGGELQDELAVIHACAAMAVRCPLPETAVAGALLAQAGKAVPAGPLALVPPAGCAGLALVDGLLDGVATGVPWAAQVGHALLPLPHGLALATLEGCDIQRGHNLAGEPRDTVRFRRHRPVALLTDVPSDALLRRGALMRSVEICAAAERALELAIGYTTTRKQFGKPLASFQAVQHQIAGAASKLAAARILLDAAYDALASGDAEREIAAARINACLAGGDCAAVAHQVHGAMGYAWEYDLHRHTSAIQAWRAEFGPLAYWAQRLGTEAGAAPSGDLWQFITS
jgi:alkylation response protein AidB-like acyl-CoA dehydrogenase